ncbi:tetratricopeptide repeat protein [Shewanella intestini]|uniref:Tetratricopeptide repeat protein n=1 Tax=Shewanella intestini TaxID=2017544 RepID=A0ABS5HYR4_9GAMM|nr:MULTISPECIES: tetratricopeptide repeat protein [Shewanella]MBR9726911.1 tetratricopeptide repeat protein [Shewanella intestini]MRG34523.1 tetratricopeptide repeat protein [Shewanella sp. XMDDZSB0408]
MNNFDKKQLKRVAQFLEQDKVTSALKIVTPLLNKKHPHELVFQYGCTTLERNKQENEALSCWQKGFDLYPDHYDIGLNLANSQIELAQYHKVHDTLGQLLSLSQLTLEQRNQIKYMQAYAYYQLDQYSKVIDLLLTKASISAQHISSQWWQLITYSQLDLEKWAQAKHSAQQWLSIDPINQTAWQILARSNLGLNNNSKAVSANVIAGLLAQSKATKPLFGDYQFLLGNIKAYDFAGYCQQQPPSSFNNKALACSQYLWLSGQYQAGLDYIQHFNMQQIAVIDDYLLLKGRLFAGIKANQKARDCWRQIGKGTLPESSAADIKLARQKRTQLQGQALLLIGQSYWLENKWPEAQASYRKLAQTPDFEPIARAYNLRLKQISH